MLFPDLFSSILMNFFYIFHRPAIIFFLTIVQSLQTPKDMLESSLQQELHKVFKCRLENRMEVNDNKTKCMHITTGQTSLTLSSTSNLHLRKR